MTTTHPYGRLLTPLEVDGDGGGRYCFYDCAKLGPEFQELPFSIRVLLESLIRNCDNFQVPWLEAALGLWNVALGRAIFGRLGMLKVTFFPVLDFSIDCS